MSLAVRAHGLVKRFGTTVALDGLDLEAEEGRVLGVLGPIGAGKTTAVRILSTLLAPDRPAPPDRRHAGHRQAPPHRPVPPAPAAGLRGDPAHHVRAAVPLRVRRAMRLPAGFTYIDYLMPGIITQTVAFGSTNTAIAMADDIQKGIIDRFRALPMSRSAVIGGRVLADLARLLLTISIMTTVGVLIGWRPDLNPVRLLGALLFALGFGQTMSWLSALVGLTLKRVEAAQAASFVGIFPLTFASSVFVPVEFMPGWLQAFARANPITLVASTMRSLTHGDPLGQSWWQALAWLVAITAIASLAATRKYKNTSE